MDLTLKELKELAKQATSGPWTNKEHIGCVETEDQPDCCDDPDCRVIATLNYGGLCRSPNDEEFNSAFIAASNPQTVLELVERVEELSNALKFYAGLTNESEWDGCKFLTFDKFGGLDEEISGPIVAKQALKQFGPDAPLKGR